VCHDFDVKTNQCTSDSGTTATALPFKQDYLTGLQTWINENGGVVYPGYTRPIRLLVEIKCAVGSGGSCADKDSPPSATSPNNPLVVLGAIDSQVKSYGSMIYTPDNPGGRVQVVITGGHNGETYANPVSGSAATSVSAVLHAASPHNEEYLDGTLDSGYSGPDPVEPLLSFAYPNLDGISNDCNVGDYAALTTPGQPTTKQMNEIVDAHANGHQVRVYGMPDCPVGHAATSAGSDLANAQTAWTDAARASIDYISSNHIDSLQSWLLDDDAAPVGGGGDCGTRQEIKADKLFVQFCTLWASNVPVHAFPDANSTTVGTLVNGGRANWFVAQTQSVATQTNNTSWCYPSHPTWCNDWWAYTQADNGQWGWVSVVYFANGSNNQPATNLYGCDVQGNTADGPQCHPY